MFTESRLRSPEIEKLPEFSLEEIEKDYRYWLADYQHAADLQRANSEPPSYVISRANHLIQLMKDHYFPELGVVQLAIENNSYKELSPEPKDKDVYLKKIDQLIEEMIEVAEKIVEKYHIEAPVFDMNKIINQYLQE